MRDLKKIASFYKSLFQLEKVDMGSMTQRILFQKAVFIAKALGLGFEEYRYGWHVHGPYSPALATDGYAIYTSDKNHCTYQFGEAELKKIGAIKQLFGKEIEDRDSNKFELYGSILFLYRDGLSDEALAKLVKDKKGWYTDEEIREGIKKIRALKSLPKE